MLLTPSCLTSYEYICKIWTSEQSNRFIVNLIHQDPDITLKELQGALVDAHEVTASVSGIDQALRRLGCTYKKSLIADERKQGQDARGSIGLTIAFQRSAPCLNVLSSLMKPLSKPT